MSLFQKIPIPICGLALGMAGLGNLIQSYSEGARLVCGIISALLLILMIIKIVAYLTLVKEDLENPVMASIFCTFPMALMILSGYLKPYAAGIATALWWIAVCFHVIMIVYFTVKFIPHLNWKTVFPSWFIVYVGIAAASMTCPAFNAQTIGQILLWFALITFVILLILVIMRYVKDREVPAPLKPLFCIFAAPASLVIVGYLQSMDTKNTTLLICLYAVACILYLAGIIRGLTLVIKDFYPSWAAFTFPFVISAIASKQTMACLTNMGMNVSFLSTVVLIETILAVLFTLYTLIRYCIFLFIEKK